MKLFASLFFIFNFAWAEVASVPAIAIEKGILNPADAPGVFVLSVLNYEDVRIDYNLDGKIDFWRIKKDDTTVEIIFNEFGEIEHIYFSKIGQKKTSEISYKRINGILILNHQRTRQHFVMNFSESDDICEDKERAFDKELKTFGQAFRLTSPTVLSKLIDPNCETALGTGYEPLKTTLLEYLRGNDKIEKCLSNKDFRSSFPSGKENDLGFAMLKTSYRLQRAQLSKNPDQYGPLLKCSKHDDERRERESISTTELGKINISVPPSMKDLNVTGEMLQHELLHRTGLFKEESVKQIISACYKMTPAKEKKYSESDPCGSIGPGLSNVASIKTADQMTAQTVVPGTKPADSSGKAVESKGVESANGGGKKTIIATEKYQASVNAAQTQTANIPQNLTVAQTGVPSSASLSEAIYSNLQKTPSGIQTAYNNSVSQSNGVFKTANNLMGAMNTKADAAVLAANTAQKRDIASATAALSNEVAGSRTTASATSSTQGLISRNKIGSDETVVESITLDSSQQAAAQAGTTTQTRSVASLTSTAGQNATTTQRSATQAQANVAAGSGELSNTATASVNPVPSSFGGSLSASGSGGGRRQPANVDLSGSAQTKTSETAISVRDKMTKFISDTKNYTLNKSRLRQPSFNKQLENEKITILDLDGNSFGAKKGETIFIDFGDRFAKQK